MVDRGVEVDVVADGDRQVHRQVGARCEPAAHPGLERPVHEDAADPLAHRLPRPGPGRHEPVERRLRELVAGQPVDRLEHAGPLGGGQVERVVADRDEHRTCRR